MDPRTFFHMVEQHEDLEYCGCQEGASPVEDEVIVRCLSKGVNTYLKVASIRTSKWWILEEVLLTKRDPNIIRRMTRICGYYSNLRGWNRSKLAELNDRRKGNYDVLGHQVVSGVAAG